MTPTPLPRPLGLATSSGMVVVALIAAAALLAVLGLATGAIRIGADRVRRSGRGTAMAFDAAFAPRGRREGIEYLLHDQHRVVQDQERGDGDPGEGHSLQLYEYLDEDDRDPSPAD